MMCARSTAVAVVAFLAVATANDLKQCAGAPSCLPGKDPNTSTESLLGGGAAAGGPLYPEGKARQQLHVLVQAGPPASPYAHSRFLRSLSVQGLAWTPLSKGPSVDAVAAALADLHNDTDVLFLENGEDVLVLAGAAELVWARRQIGSIVIASRQTCGFLCPEAWATVEGVEAHSHVDGKSFIGRVSHVRLLLDAIRGRATAHPSQPLEQHLAALFSSPSLRKSLDMHMDRGNTIFQSLDGLPTSSGSTLVAQFASEEGTPISRLFNVEKGSHPAILRGNGNTRRLNALGSVVPAAWSPQEGCLLCREGDIGHNKALSTPLLIGVVIDKFAPLLELSLWTLGDLHVPTNTIWHAAVVDGARQDTVRAALPRKATVSQHANSFEARRHLLAMAASHPEHHFALTSSLARLTNPEALLNLIMQNGDVVSPVLRRETQADGTFWTDTYHDFDSHCVDLDLHCGVHRADRKCEDMVSRAWMLGHCARTCGFCRTGGDEVTVDFGGLQDFVPILSRERVGVWDVPIVFGVVLLKPHVVQRLATVGFAPRSPAFQATDPQMSDLLFCQLLRREGFHLFATNRVEFGTLLTVLYQPKDKPLLHPDLHAVVDNPQTWAEQYIHKRYHEYKQAGFLFGRCWDVYQVPLFSARFCRELVEEAEHLDKWSSGSEADDRLESGYEAVPTRDIHFDQMGYERAWFKVLQVFVAPIVAKLWNGYELDGERTLNFIVKYSAVGQPSLPPHNDASTFTFNVALNNPGVDFEGGGTHFLRQNCTIRDNPMGYAVFHPGRLTHTHEGLPISSGVRYILVSFVDQTS